MPHMTARSISCVLIVSFKSGSQPINHCPHTEVSTLPAGSANAFAASAEHSDTQKHCSPTAVQKTLSNVQHGSSNAAADPAAPFSNALLSAQPYSGFIMLFAGTGGQVGQA